MLAEPELRKNRSEEGKSGQLLQDVEAISRALYLHIIPAKQLISQPENLSKSSGRTKSTKPTLKPKFDGANDGLLHKDKKLLPWNWKKPLKALAHIRDRKFHCYFYLHVHSIKGLPSDFNEHELCVHWIWKTNVLRTKHYKVHKGMAEFEETLVHRGSIYGRRSRLQYATKYEMKLSVLNGSAVGAMGGKHLVDLTRILPPSLVETEGKWTTSFNLTGRIRGATLNVSFGYSVMGNNSVELPGNLNGPLLLDINQSSSGMPTNVADGHSYNVRGMVWSVESVSRKQGTEFSVDQHSELEFDSFSKHPQLPKKSESFTKCIENYWEYEHDDIEYTIIEKGTECSAEQQSELEGNVLLKFTRASIEVMDATEIFGVDEGTGDREVKMKDGAFGSYGGYSESESSECREKSVRAQGSRVEQVESGTDCLFLSEYDNSVSSPKINEFIAEENQTATLSYGITSKMVKSRSLDDVTEDVANDFLNMLEMEDNSCNANCDSDPESPRERLLREFEEETFASGNFMFDISEKEDNAGVDCAVTLAEGAVPGDYRLPLVIQDGEQECKSANWSLISKRRAGMLENIEIETVMQDWGLNETAFLSSPCYGSGGFGSPIDLPHERQHTLPSLEKCLDLPVKTNNEGILRSKSSPHF